MTDSAGGSPFSLDSSLAVLAPSVIAALASKGDLRAAISEVLRRESPGCLSVPLLSHELTNELRQNLPLWLPLMHASQQLSTPLLA